MFARFLNLPTVTEDADLNIDSKELTNLIEEEVNHKVNSILSEASVGIQDGEIKVPSTLSSMTIASRVLNKTKHCLRTCLIALSCCCADNSPVIEHVDKSMARVPSESTISERKTGPCYSCFSVFARKNFKKMQTNIESEIQLKGSVGSPLRSLPATPTGSVLTGGSSLNLPGPSSCRTPSPAISPKRPSTPQVNYETIQKEVDEIFEDIHTNISTGSTQQRLQKFIQSGKVRELAEKLVETTHNHFRLHYNYESHCSDDASDKEELHSIVKDEVSSFIRNLGSYMQRDPTEELSDADLAKISDTMPPVIVGSPVVDLLQAPAPSPVSGSSFDQQQTNIFAKADTMQSNVSVPSFRSADVPAVVSRTPQEEQKQSSPEVSSKTSVTPEQLTKGQLVIKSIVVDFLTKTLQNEPNYLNDHPRFTALVDRLVQKAWCKIDIKDSHVKKTSKSLDNIVDEVLRDLTWHYGTQKLLQSLLDESDAFDDLLVKYLDHSFQKLVVKKQSLLSRACRFITSLFRSS